MSAKPNSGSGSSGGGGSGSNNGSGGGPCGACKFLRRKCVPSCIFAPHFDSEQGASNFAVVHKVFGASNVSKLLLSVAAHKRPDAVATICYEAQARVRDPVYGCVAHIFALQQQVVTLQAELSYQQAHLATLQAPQPHPPPPQAAMVLPALSNTDLPPGCAASAPVTYDLSSLFEPVVSQSSWASQQRPIELRQHAAGGPSSTAGDLQSLALELLLHRRGSPPTAPAPCSNASSSPSLSK